VAPVVISVVLWVVTASPFALVFAALGPVTAAASFVDSRVSSRRLARREAERFRDELDAAAHVIQLRHAEERGERDEAHPSAATIVARRGADPYRWRALAEGPVLVSLGRGDGVSDLGWDPSVPRGGADVMVQLDSLSEAARTIPDVPVIVDAGVGIGVCGPAPVAEAVARAIVVQLAWTLSPARFWMSAPAGSWTFSLPHSRGPAVRAGFAFEWGAMGDRDPIAGVAVAATAHELPGACRVVVAVEGGVVSIIQHPDRAQRRQVRAQPLSLEAARRWAPRLRGEAVRERMVVGEAHVASHVSLAPLLRAPVANEGLACELGESADGPVTLDLVEHGPHAVIGGTTGSGKSELLVSWVLAMAAPRSPETVTFLLVDFKGGAAFAPLATLPHTVGIITDLDDHEADRAFRSLRAELRYRERIIAESPGRRLESAPLARLVIVVDEFAAMVADHSDLHAVFADIAARGRSLGMHLVLCTQRPSTAVRDGVLANADLRISLRVNNAADSISVVGDESASRIAASARGRGVIALAGQTAQPVQFALASESELHSVATRWRHAPPVRRAWCPPLPRSIPLSALAPPPTGIAFGVADLPDEQRQRVVAWAPKSQGNLLVLGAPSSGKTVAVEVVGADGLWIPRDSAAAWDAIESLAGVRERLVVVDDVDALLARYAQEYREVIVERFTEALRDGPQRGLHLVASAQRLTSDLQRIATLMPSRLLLRQANRQEHVLAGGASMRYSASAAPGAGEWEGMRVQVATAGAPPSRAEMAPRSSVCAPDRPIAIVSSRSSIVVAKLRDAGFVVVEPHETADLGAGVAIVAGPDEWQSRWGAITALRDSAHILFDACTTADYRAITRSRELPPPLDGHPDLLWRWEPSGRASRVRLGGIAQGPSAAVSQVVASTVGQASAAASSV
jgi:S-DNA-T family DNA segregation ATPase FtsK/SpoIIIE